MSTTLLLITVGMIIGVVIGLMIAFAAAVCDAWPIAGGGVAMILISLLFGFTLTSNISQQHDQKIQTQINRTNVKIAVNQTKINQSIKTLKQQANNSKDYRQTQADYYAQLQTQKQLEKRLSHEKSQLSSYQRDHDRGGLF